MVFIAAEAYKNARVDVIKDNETDNYYWVKIRDVQNGLGIKNMRDRLERNMQGIFEIKKLTEEQKNNI